MAMHDTEGACIHAFLSVCTVRVNVVRFEHLCECISDASGLARSNDRQILSGPGHACLVIDIAADK